MGKVVDRWEAVLERMYESLSSKGEPYGVTL